MPAEAPGGSLGGSWGICGSAVQLPRVGLVGPLESVGPSSGASPHVAPSVLPLGLCTGRLPHQRCLPSLRWALPTPWAQLRPPHPWKSRRCQVMAKDDDSLWGQQAASDGAGGGPAGHLSLTRIKPWCTGQAALSSHSGPPMAVPHLEENTETRGGAGLCLRSTR